MEEIEVRKCRVCQKVKPLTSKYFNNRHEIQSAPPFRWDCKVCYNAFKRTHPGYTERKMLQHARNRSRLYGREFSLTIEDIKIPETCPVLNMKLVSGWDDDENSPTLERIDNNKGYVKSNVMVVSALANRIKNSATYQQILTVGWFYKKLYQQQMRLTIKTRFKNLTTKGKKDAPN